MKTVIKLFLPVVFLLGNYSVFKAQYSTLGIRVNGINNNNYNYDANYSNTNTLLNNYGNNTNSKVSNISVNLLGEKILDTTNLYRFRAGINYSKSKAKSENSYDINNPYQNQYTRNSTSDNLSVAIAGGVGKIFVYEKFAFRVGIELFGNYTLSYHNNSKSDTYLNGNKISEDNSVRSPNVNYSTGASFFSSVYYNFRKKFSVGFEINNGVLMSYSKYTTTDKTEQYNSSGTIINTQTSSNSFKTTNYSTFFLSPSLGVLYKF